MSSSDSELARAFFMPAEPMNSLCGCGCAVLEIDVDVELLALVLALLVCD